MSVLTPYRRASADTATPRLKARSIAACSRWRQAVHCGTCRAGMLQILAAPLSVTRPLPKQRFNALSYRTKILSKQQKGPQELRFGQSQPGPNNAIAYRNGHSFILGDGVPFFEAK